MSTTKFTDSQISEKIIDLSASISKQLNDPALSEKFSEINQQAKDSQFFYSINSLLEVVGPLFNTDPKDVPKLKYEIFNGIVVICNDNKLIKSVLQPHFVNLLQLTASWEIPQHIIEYIFEKCAFFAYQEGLETDGLDLERQLLTTVYPVGGAKSIDCASKLIIRLLNNESYFAFDTLINLEAVQALSKFDNGGPSLEYSVLSILASGNSASFASFVAEKTPEKLTSSKINVELLTYKIKMISLAALGAQELGKGLSYDKIASRIFDTSSDISDLDIELLIIDTIRNGLINAKIDQLNRTATVTRSIHREFGINEWKLVSSHLNSWKSSLNDLVPVIQNAKLVAQLSNSSAPAVVEISN
ncbi:Eukaryotic translation initiation factor 3 subunit M [Smittium culicis]|uniref:Eukaryotic translation initiation factor 3 subunit M n=1 Tax=Smittium culicis TaxID=133412 RepID=A0A1R1YA84_9FUNG|nr:Eukaryotic translation initiation factor 3 subunit M [Smittium culicis]